MRTLVNMLVKTLHQKREFTFLSRIHIAFMKYDYKENLNRHYEMMSHRPLKVQLKLDIKHIKIVKIQPKFRNWKKNNS